MGKARVSTIALSEAGFFIMTRVVPSGRFLWTLGDDAYVQDFLLQKERELCGDPETGDVGTIARVTAALSERSAHCAHTAIFYSLQNRVDYVLSVHLPSQTRQLAAAVDEALRKAYARSLGADILNPAGDHPEQPDPTFTRDRFSLKHSLGGGGFRLTAGRIPFLNSLFSALPAISGSAAQGQRRTDGTIF